MKSVSELFEEVLRKTTDDIYCTCPCQVINVDNNYVDVKIFINDSEPDQILYNVPIQRPETQRAYIFLGIKKGDRGVLKFFDRSTEGYLQSDFDYNSDERQHDINDRVFSLGFIPDSESYVYPTDKEIEIGLKNNTCKISINADGSLVINSTVSTTVTAPTVTINGNVVVNGTITATGEITGNSILLSTHKHGGVTSGKDETGEPTKQ